MSKKDYIRGANIVRGFTGTPEFTVVMQAMVLLFEENDGFDSRRFVEACLQK
jgi:hypothetical protein